MIDSVNSVILRCDELWVFGEVSEGVWYEVRMCKDMNIPIRYFSIYNLPDTIQEIMESEVSYTQKFLKSLNIESSKFVAITDISNYPPLDLA